MSNTDKGKAILFRCINAMEQLTLENLALYHLLQKTWPHYYQSVNYQILEQALEAAKADPQVTGHVRELYAQSREQIESGIGQAEALELLKAFPPKSGPN